MARGRKKKTVLNQKPEVEEGAKLLAPDIESVQPIKDPVVGWVNPEIEQNPEEIVEKILEKKEQEEISLRVSGKKLAEALEKKEEVVAEKQDVEEVEEEPKIDETPRPAGIRSLSKEVRNSLSRRELRYFQRTGILPK